MLPFHLPVVPWRSHPNPLILYSVGFKAKFKRCEILWIVSNQLFCPLSSIIRLNPFDLEWAFLYTKKTCLSEAALVRLLVKGYEPKERPDERFYDVMRQLSSIGNNINQLAAQANTLGFVDAPKLKKEAERWHKFQADVERQFLRPDKCDMKWQ